MNNSNPDGGVLRSILSLVMFVILSFGIIKFVVRVFTPSTAPVTTASSTAATPTPEPTPTPTPTPTPHPDQADADRIGYPLDQYLDMKQTMLDCGFDETTIRLVQAVGSHEAYCHWGRPRWVMSRR